MKHEDIEMKVCIFFDDSFHSQIVAVLNTRSLTYNERLYLPLLHELLPESAIVKENGEVIPYRDVIKGWNADTLFLQTMNGLTMRSSTFSFGQYFHFIGLHLQVWNEIMVGIFEFLNISSCILYRHA